MKKNIYLLIIILILSTVVVPADKDGKKEDEKLSISFVFDNFMQKVFPGSEFYSSIIENYLPETTSIIEESNGFAIIDNPKVYFEGDSFTRFNWYYNGLDINSSLNDGSPAVIIPFLSVSNYKLYGQTPMNNIYGLNQISDFAAPNGSKLSFSTIYSDMGTFSNWSQKLINTPATERNERLSEKRRKLLNNYYISYDFNKKNNNTGIKFSLTYFDIKRQFNDFNKINTVFEETGRLFTASLQYGKILNKGVLSFFSVINNSDKSNLDSELGVYPQETTDLKRFSAITGIMYNNSSFDFALRLLYEDEKREPFTKNFTKDLMDNDGSGFILPLKYGEFRATSLLLKSNIKLLNSDNYKLKLYGKLKFTKNDAWEDTNDYNIFTVGNTPYLIREWEAGSSYNNNLLDIKLGIVGNMNLSDSLKLIGKLYFHKTSLTFDNSANNLSYLTPSYDMGIILWPKSKGSLLLSFGSFTDDLNNIIGFLEQKRPSSIYYFWNDKNGDGIYQTNERGNIYGYSGGKYHFADNNLKTPITKRLLVSLNTRISKNYRLLVKGIYKIVKNNYWVYFDRDYGFYDENLYYFDKPFKNYYLSNSLLKDEPFSAELLINFIGKKKEKWFFSFSFMAHIGMGNTSFGNGFNNDIGIIDESMANPNAWLNGFGRVDGDRGFVSKLNYGIFLSKNLSIGLNLKYRDGNPFTFMKMSDKHNQWVIYYKTIKGENKEGKKGGPREDYLADLNFKLNYSLKLAGTHIDLSLSAFNILDVGYELSERVFTDERDRLAAELQIPRSMRFSINISF